MQTLNDEMRCGIFTNADGDILIIHDKKISDAQWIEYHKDSQKLFIIHDDCQSQDLGLSFDHQTQNNISSGVEITIIGFYDGTIQPKQVVPLVIQDY